MIRPLSLFLALGLAGCAAVPGGPGGGAALEPGVFAPTTKGPEGALPGTCWGRTVRPAVIETVRERIEVAPAQVNPDGTLAALPRYRTEERQRIVTPRQDNWFLTPCAEVRGPDFVASLQRALQARGYYGGAITGQMDEPTRAAIQGFQRAGGFPDSGVLSLAAAQQLGLVEAAL